MLLKPTGVVNGSNEGGGSSRMWRGQKGSGSNEKSGGDVRAVMRDMEARVVVGTEQVGVTVRGCIASERSGGGEDDASGCCGDERRGSHCAGGFMTMIIVNCDSNE